MDDVYQKDRDNEQKARTVEEGLFQGFSRFGASLLEGVTGVVTQPIRAHQQERTVESVFKGIGIGLAGIVTKPVTGFADLIAKSAEGIANQGFYDQQIVKRVRPPRFFDETSMLLLYDELKSTGQTLLYSIEGGIYKQHFYRFHRRIFGKWMLMLSNKALLILRPAGQYEGDFVTEKAIPVQRLQSPLVPHIDSLTVHYKDEKGIPNRQFKIIVNHKDDIAIIFNALVGYCCSNTTSVTDIIIRNTSTKPDPRIGQTKEGFLDFRENDIFLIGELWKQYTCSIGAGYFMFRPSDDPSAEKQVKIRLAGIQIFQKADGVFVVTYKNDSLHFRCSSYKEALEWIDVLRQNGAVI